LLSTTALTLARPPDRTAAKKVGALSVVDAGEEVAPRSRRARSHVVDASLVVPPWSAFFVVL
jgi:hypothetical protein